MKLQKSFTFALSRRFAPSLSPRFSRSHSTASPDEIEHFSKLAHNWWDSQGPQRILHKMNLSRMDYIRDTLSKYNNPALPLPGYSVDLLPEPVKSKYTTQTNSSSIGTENQYTALDIGCGGGLLAESLARLNEIKSVLGIDLTPDVLKVANDHMKKDPSLPSKLSYQLVGIDQLEPSQQFDIVTMFEMLEHVPRPSEVLESTLNHVKPGGFLFISTINRTPISYFTTIFMGEHVLNIVPKGTHTYEKYINEQELRDWFSKRSEWEVVRSDGVTFIPLLDWQLTKNRSIGNYYFVARRKL